MKAVLYLVGAILIVIAIVYFVMPADQLPGFMPGHEAGLARPRMKHGIVSAVVGVVLFGIAWFRGRSRA